MPTPRLMIYGYYGQGNLGDDLLSAHVLSVVREAVGLDGVAVKSGPSKCLTRWFPGIEPLSPRAFMAEARRSGAPVLFGGGGLFKAFAPRELWKRTAAGQALRRLKTGWRVVRGRFPWFLRGYAYCVGVGPIEDAVRAWEIRLMLRRCPEVSVRDRRSLEDLARIGVPHGRLAVDAAAGPIAEALASLVAPVPGSVGIVVRDWDAGEGGEILARLMAAAAQLRRGGRQVSFVSFAEADDRAGLARLREAGETPLVWLPDTMTVAEFLCRLCTFETLATMRAHAVYIGAYAGRRVVPVVVEQKLAAVPDALGLEGPRIALTDPAGEIARKIGAGAAAETGPAALRRDLALLDAERGRLVSWLRETVRS